MNFHRQAILFPLLILLLLVSTSCSEGTRDVTLDFSGRYILTMVPVNENCAWDLLGGVLNLDQDQETIVLSVTNMVPPTPGTVNPSSGTFTVRWQNEFAGVSIMDGEIDTFGRVVGTYHATKPDKLKIDGCYLDAEWKGERFF